MKNRDGGKEKKLQSGAKGKQERIHLTDQFQRTALLKQSLLALSPPNAGQTAVSLVTARRPFSSDHLLQKDEDEKQATNCDFCPPGVQISLEGDERLNQAENEDTHERS